MFNAPGALNIPTPIDGATVKIIGVAVCLGGCRGCLKSNSPALRCTASTRAIVYGFLRRAGIAGEPAPALDHAAEPVPLDGTGSMHARVECGWPGGLLGGSRPGLRIPRVGAPRRRSKVM